MLEVFVSSKVKKVRYKFILCYLRVLILRIKLKITPGLLQLLGYLSHNFHNTVLAWKKLHTTDWSCFQSYNISLHNFRTQHLPSASNNTDSSSSERSHQSPLMEPNFYACLFHRRPRLTFPMNVSKHKKINGMGQEHRRQKYLPRAIKL